MSPNKRYVTVKNGQGEIIYDGPEQRNSEPLANTLIWQVMVGAVGIVIVGCGAFYTHAQAKFSEYDKVAIARGERLKELEVNYKAIDTRLTRMEDKIDDMVDSVSKIVRIQQIPERGRK